MRFARINNKWYEVYNNKLYNYYNGCSPSTINDIDDDFYCRDWHDLYCTTSYNPLSASFLNDDLWIAPNGECFDGQSHTTMADYICEIVYGMDYNVPTFNGEQAGWIKTSRDFWTWILNDHDPDHNPWCMTPAQENTLRKWCNAHNIPFPTQHIKKLF